MVVELVGAGDEVGAALKAEVHDDDGFEAFGGDFAETLLSLSSGLPELRPLRDPWVMTWGMPTGPRKPAGPPM